MNQDWQGILDDGEDILWQGRPDGAIVFRAQQIFTLLFGLAFAGFAVFWMVLAMQAGGFIWMFGLIHFSAGIFIAFGTIFLDAFVRRRTWYTLTNQRAFIATDLPIFGRGLKSYPITPETTMDFSGEGLTTIHFASRRVRVRRGSRQRAIGFERITDGEKVMRLMRDIQKRPHV